MIDYDRQYLEHPEFIPESVRKRLNMDFERGSDPGRIYRVLPAQPRHERGLLAGALSATDLAGLLEHPNGWHRETAHRLLIERQDKSAMTAIAAVFRESANPAAPIHALWTLE